MHYALWFEYCDICLSLSLQVKSLDLNTHRYTVCGARIKQFIVPSTPIFRQLCQMALHQICMRARCLQSGKHFRDFFTRVRQKINGGVDELGCRKGKPTKGRSRVQGRCEVSPSIAQASTGNEIQYWRLIKLTKPRSKMPKGASKC